MDTDFENQNTWFHNSKLFFFGKNITEYSLQVKYLIVNWIVFIITLRYYVYPANYYIVLYFIMNFINYNTYNITRYKRRGYMWFL